MVVLTAIVGTGIVLLALNFRRKISNSYHLTQTIIVEPDRKFFRDDQLLGFRPQKGEYTISLLIDSTPKPLKFRVTIKRDGYRATQLAPGKSQKHIVAVFGCSFSWGWGIDDDRTFPWLLQKWLKNTQVLNFAGPGYGNVHALLQMPEFLALPGDCKIAVFSYCDFHLPRNVAAPSRLSEFLSIHGIGLMHHPQAFLAADGSLHVRSVPLLPVDKKDPSRDYMLEVSRKIFDRIIEMCRLAGVISILAFQSGPDNDPIVKYCGQIGFHIVDIRVDNLNKKFNKLPYDLHPNEEAHFIYAKRLLKVIENLEQQRHCDAPK